MPGRRLAVTTLAMGLVALALGALGPDVAALQAAAVHPQRVADTTGPDAVVLAWAAVLAWLVWGWGLLGLLLTAASALPGLLGSAARVALRAVLPRAARRAVAIALGVSIGAGIGAPVLATAVTPGGAVATAPDWPAATPADPSPVPDWPSPTTGEHVVVRGDCLWDIAAARLRQDAGRDPTGRETAVAVSAWWEANATVIGPDADLLLPGQVLRPPAP